MTWNWEERVCNVAKLREVLEREDLDAVVSVAPEHSTYLSGVAVGGYTLENADGPRKQIVVWPRDGEPTLVIQSTSVRTGEQCSWIDDVRGYTEYVESPYRLACDVLAEQGLADGRVGVERRQLGVERWEEIRDALPGADLVECTSLLEEVRSIKTEHEVALLRESERILQDALDVLFEEAQPGDTLAELETKMRHLLACESGVRAGGGLSTRPGTEYLRFLGKDEPLAEGDVLRTDFSCYYKNYGANLSQHAVVGEPDDEQAATYDTLRRIHRETVAATFRPGVAGREIYDYFVGELRAEGLDGELPLLAHGIGPWHHRERPIAHPAESRELEEGMVMVMESCFGEFWHLQDEFIITADGYEWLSDPEKTEEMAVIR